MAKKRYTGRSALVSLVSTSATTFTVGLCRSIQPPPQTRAIIDLTGMEDATFVGTPGIEEQSIFTFTSLHDLDDAADDIVNTLYGSGSEVTWRVTATDGDLTWVKSFAGKVSGLEPQAFGGNDPITRQVSVIRTGAVTDSTS